MCYWELSGYALCFFHSFSSFIHTIKKKRKIKLKSVKRGPETTTLKLIAGGWGWGWLTDWKSSILAQKGRLADGCRVAQLLGPMLSASAAWVVSVPSGPAILRAARRDSAAKSLYNRLWEASRGHTSTHEVLSVWGGGRQRPQSFFASVLLQGFEPATLPGPPAAAAAAAPTASGLKRFPAAALPDFNRVCLRDVHLNDSSPAGRGNVNPD